MNLRGRSKSNIHLAEVECYNCHKKGHFKLSCPWMKRIGKCKISHFKNEYVDVVVAFDNYESAGMLLAFVLAT